MFDGIGQHLLVSCVKQRKTLISNEHSDRLRLMGPVATHHMKDSQNSSDKRSVMGINLKILFSTINLG